MDIKLLYVRLKQSGLSPQFDSDTITVLGHTIRGVTLECSNIVGLGIASNDEICDFLTHEVAPFSMAKWDMYHLTRTVDKNLFHLQVFANDFELKVNGDDRLLIVDINVPYDNIDQSWSALLQRGSHWLTVKMPNSDTVRLGDLAPLLVSAMSNELPKPIEYTSSNDLLSAILVKATSKTSLLKHLIDTYPHNANVSLSSNSLSVTLNTPNTGNTVTATLPDMPDDRQVLACDIAQILDTYGFTSRSYSRTVASNVIASLADFDLPKALAKSLKKPISTKNELIYQLRLFAPNLASQGATGQIKVLSKGEEFILQITTEYETKNSSSFTLPLTLLQLLAYLTETLSHVNKA